MTLLVRDEEDIIDWNLRYHLSRGVDHFVVTDNLSVDGTADILREYERQGLVTYLYESDDDFSQDLWVTRMAELAQAELQPDWLLHCDADEFWWPEEATTLGHVFSAVPAKVPVVRVDRRSYLGPAAEDPRPFFARMVLRELQPVNELGYPPPPKIAHRPLKEPYVHQGNHAVSDGGRKLRAKRLRGVSILHFPARTPAQLRNKILKGGAAYQRNARFDETVGSTWRALYRRILADDFDRVLEACFVNGEGDARRLIEDHRLREYLTSL